MNNSARSPLTRVLLTTIILSSGCSLFGGSEKEEGKKIIAAPTIPEEELLEDALKAYDRGLFSVANQRFTELRDGYPGSYYSVLAELKIADATFYSGDFAPAQIAYEEFARVHPAHEAIPYVRYQIGRCNIEQYKDETRDQTPLNNAIKGFKELIQNYPSSEYALLARREINRARELIAEHEAFVAKFYLKQGMLKSSANRLKVLKEEYPDSYAARNVKGELAEEYAEQAGEAEKLVTETKAGTVGGKPGAAPSAPRILLAEKSDSMDPIIRLRGKLQLTSSPAEVVSKPTSTVVTATKVVGAKPLVTDLKCEDTEGSTIVTAFMRSPFTLNSEDSAAYKVSAPAPQGATVIDEERKNISCESGSLSASISQDISAGQILGKLHVENRELKRAEALILDRPHRLVLVFQKGEPESKPEENQEN